MRSQEKINRIIEKELKYKIINNTYAIYCDIQKYISIYCNGAKFAECINHQYIYNLIKIVYI